MKKSTEQKKILLTLLDGYKRVNKIIMEEKKMRLARLTSEESFREYDALCKMEETIKKDRLENLEKRKISFLIKRRYIFNKAGRGRENL